MKTRQHYINACEVVKSKLSEKELFQNTCSEKLQKLKTPGIVSFSQ